LTIKNGLNLQDNAVRQAILGQSELRDAIIPDSQSTPSCQGYLFWDEIHPSASIHQKIAEFAKHLIETQF
jgi:phospholipase/lecithinase/hemolysin